MQRKEIQRGDLFYYDFGKREGSVQSGERPVMVIQADNFNANAPTIIVAAVTAVMKKKYLPSHIILGEDFGLKKPSMVLLEQIQTVNKDELTDYIGSVNDERLWKQINAALKKTFGLWMDNDVLAYRALLEKRKENAPFWEKKVLTVEEAAEYTGIGRTKIRQIIMKGDCPFAVTNGVQVCVIRDKFIDYLDKQFRI